MCLILCLFLCLIDYQKLLQVFEQNKSMIISVLLFSIWIAIVAYYHKAPLNELDNYYRFLLLLPILVINLPKNYLENILYLGAGFAIIHLLFNIPLINRYQGTSSTAITYAYLCLSLIHI